MAKVICNMPNCKNRFGKPFDEKEECPECHGKGYSTLEIKNPVITESMIDEMRVKTRAVDGVIWTHFESPAHGLDALFELAKEGWRNKYGI